MFVSNVFLVMLVEIVVIGKNIQAMSTRLLWTWVVNPVKFDILICRLMTVLWHCPVVMFCYSL